MGVAQLVRAPGCGPGGRGFESHHSPKYQALVAQLDRALGFGPSGYRFESCRGYNNIIGDKMRDSISKTNISRFNKEFKRTLTWLDSKR